MSKELKFRELKTSNALLKSTTQNILRKGLHRLKRTYGFGMRSNYTSIVNTFLFEKHI
jgi:hypothetical protein